MKIYKIRLHYQVEKLITFPHFIAPTIRGIFGYALKHNNKNAFDILFEKSENGAKIKPYTITAPKKTQLAYLPNDNFHFDITFFGDIIKQISLKTFIDFEKYSIGKQNGKLKFIKAENLIFNDKKQIFNLQNSKNYNFKLISKKQITNLSIKFISPVCIQNVNSTKDITFVNILKRIYERLVNLKLINKEIIPIPNFAEAQNVICTQSNFVRYNVKHHSRIRNQFIYYKPAFIGSAEYYGNLTPFINILKIGELLQIGRGTTSGLGQFEINMSAV